MAGLTSMNVRRLRSLMWLLTVALVVMAGLQVMKILESHKKGLFEPRKEDYFRGIIAAAEEVPVRDDGPTTPSLAALAGLWEKPLNGYVPPKKEPEVQAPVEVESKADPIDKHVVLLMITEDPTSGGLVSVEYIDEKIPALYREETLLKVGDPLKYPYDEPPYEAKVKRIGVDAVVFEWAGEEAELKLADLTAEAIAGEISDEPTVALSDDEKDVLSRYADASQTTRIRELSNADQEAYRIGTEDANAFGGSGDEFRNFVRLDEAPAGTGGGKQVVFATVRPQAKKYGVEQGDVLISVNGVAISSRTQGIQWVRNHPNEPRYEVKLLRKGREVTKVYYPPEKD